MEQMCDASQCLTLASEQLASDIVCLVATVGGCGQSLLKVAAGIIHRVDGRHCWCRLLLTPVVGSVNGPSCSFLNWRFVYCWDVGHAVVGVGKG